MSLVTTEARDGVLLIGLNRPDKRNAFTAAMLGELSEAYGELDRNQSHRCGLLFAHGLHFTGGLDLAEVGPRVAAGEELFPSGGVDPVGITGRRVAKPVVCAVQGYCLTIGIELLLAADIRLAADDCKFSQLEVARGIMPFGGATLRFHRATGWGNAMRWMLTGDFFDAPEALRIGLVQETSPADSLFDRAFAIAATVARQAPLAVQATLAASRAAWMESDQRGIDGLMSTARGLMSTEDAREGVQSFIERRTAKFSGK